MSAGVKVKEKAAHDSAEANYGELWINSSNGHLMFTDHTGTDLDVSAAPPGGSAGGDLGSTYPNPTVLQASGAFAFAGVISPSQITANQDDYNPTGLATASVLRLSTDASRNITGIVGGASGRILRIVNIGSFNIVLKHDVTSTVGNRFYCNNSEDAVILPNGKAMLMYDNTSQRWRVLIGTKTLPAGAIVGTTDAQTLSGKTLTNPIATSQALTDGANIDWNMDNGQEGTVTLGGSRIFNAPTNLKAGGVYILKITQDGTGGRQITWNAVFKYAGQPELAASAVTVFTFISDGTSLFRFGARQPSGEWRAAGPGATPTYNTDFAKVFVFTALAAAITSMTSGRSGTLFGNQIVIFWFKDDGSARAITWGTDFKALGVALPTTTVISKWLIVGFMVDSVDGKLGCVAVDNEA